MNISQITVLAILTLFYGAWFFRQVTLCRRGVEGVRLGQGDKASEVRCQERRLAAATLLLGIVQYVVALTDNALLAVCPTRAWMWVVGTVAGVVGIAYLVMALSAMQTNWRAGIDTARQTGLVQSGIYRFSRNPVFVGFALMYCGVLLILPNYLLVVLTGVALVLCHRQIVCEERYLAQRFGEEYEVYCCRTWRY